jgi:hypothetical protein
MGHPSEELIANARQRLAGRDAAEFCEQIERMREAFRAEDDLDAEPLRKGLAAMESPHGLMPPSPPTVRGSVGAWFFRRQFATFSWIPRAFLLRDRLLRGLHDAILREAEARVLRERAHLLRIRELERRVRDLERSVNGGFQPAPRPIRNDEPPTS